MTMIRPADTNHYNSILDNTISLLHTIFAFLERLSRITEAIVHIITLRSFTKSLQILTKLVNTGE